MKLSQAQSRRDNSVDVIGEYEDRLERHAEAIREGIKSDPEAMANALDTYLDEFRVDIDAGQLLTGFIPALIGAEKFVDAIAHGDALPDAELQAFRELCRQIETAQKVMDKAVEEAVTEVMTR